MKKLLTLLFVFIFCAGSLNAQNISPIGSSGGGGSGLTPAPSNLTFYVAPTPTGNDDNLCTLTSKCATPQRAINIAATYDYQLLYTWSINVADGTYTSSGDFLTIPAFVNLNPSAVQTLEGNSTTPANVVFKAGVNGAGITQVPTAITNQLVMDGFTVHLTANFKSWFRIQGGSCLYGSLTIDADAGLTEIAVWQVGPSGEGGAIADLDTNGGFTFTVNSGFSFYYFIQGNPVSQSNFNFTQFNFPASLTIHGAWANSNGALINWSSNTFTNFSGVVGSQSNIQSFSTMITDNGLLSDFPGNAAGFADNTTVVVNNNTGTRAIIGIPNAGIPTGTDIPQGTWKIIKDTTGGGVYVIYNDAGTIKKVQLN